MKKNETYYVKRISKICNKWIKTKKCKNSFGILAEIQKVINAYLNE